MNSTILTTLDMGDDENLKDARFYLDRAQSDQQLADWARKFGRPLIDGAAAGSDKAAAEIADMERQLDEADAERAMAETDAEDANARADDLIDEIRDAIGVLEKLVPCHSAIRPLIDALNKAIK